MSAGVVYCCLESRAGFERWHFCSLARHIPSRFGVAASTQAVRDYNSGAEELQSISMSWE
ncbi:hypothetical protein SAMN05216404_1392 [Nitrosospira multiformis]|uniref:Uncharacterized protein n=1 Tax=Nitrosospira multiformis TaxID=1231 RepID=A0A1H8QIG7_9PROT|nr:hypothetical protein SAMN05216404_1392 [Nitrosospira multiformis]